ncbi:MAG: 3-methyl-2-oxobutanoate hydroxymethyltransferase, partial [Gemmatimonadota bacterium]|nr:3-methyl-2-oxobutanoate hydroxymethyltransferase [Gemmatimonadota bacterium]
MPESKPVSMAEFVGHKKKGEKIVMVTAYDALFGRLVDESGVDAILVGDSVATALFGQESTLPVTLDQMIYHAAAVRRGVKRSLIVIDMPFLTYQASVELAIL